LWIGSSLDRHLLRATSRPIEMCATDSEVLQARAMTLLHGVRTNRDTTTAQQALHTLRAEITDLRAELPWRKAKARNEHSLLVHTATWAATCATPWIL
jgi:hypothetical protein